MLIRPSAVIDCRQFTRRPARWLVLFLGGAGLGLWADVAAAGDEPPLRPITVYERSSEVLAAAKSLVEGDRVYLPFQFLVDNLGCRRKRLSSGRVGVCRGEVCVPLRAGQGSGDVRRIGGAEFIPVAPFVSALGGKMSFSATTGDLLLDLTRRDESPASLIGTEFDLVLPDLTGKPVSLSAYRGKKVLLFAWASW